MGVLTWCEWLLSLTSPALSTGTAHAPRLLFDMNKLFEAYVSGVVERTSGDDFVAHRHQLLAYAMRYRCTRLELVYPQLGAEADPSGSLPEFEIADVGLGLGNIEVRIGAVSLWG